MTTESIISSMITKAQAFATTDGKNRAELRDDQVKVTTRGRSTAEPRSYDLDGFVRKFSSQTWAQAA